jgi:hypothetical protein
VPGGSDQIADVGAIAIASAGGRAFAPRRANALLQFFPHHVFDQDLDGTHRQTAYMLTEFFPARRSSGDEGSAVEPSGLNVVGLFLGTGIAFSFREHEGNNLRKQSMPVVFSEKPLLYTTLGMLSKRTDDRS